MQPKNQHTFDSIDRTIRREDPIETAIYGLDQQQTEAARRDTGRIDEILQADHTLTPREKTELYEMGINLRLDWIYSKHGGRALDTGRFEAEAKDALGFFAKAAGHADTTGDPTELWKVQTKMLDLEAVRAGRYLKESQTTFRGTGEEAKIRELANNRMRKTLWGSCELMKAMEAHAHGGSRLAQDTRGMLYEQIVLTYSRFRTYEDESFDDVLVRSALTREDRPINGHVVPKRSFDLVIETPDETKLYQAKNYNNTDEYAPPIHKVMDPSFGHTLDEMKQYIGDIRILVRNPSDPNTRDRVDHAAAELDRVFGTQLELAG